MKICFYRILGIPVRATQDEIKRAFRRLALRWHPDRNAGDPKAAERFKEALRAYETLIDPKARGKYDRSQGYRGQRNKSSYSRDFEESRDGSATSFEEIFEEAFGIRGKRVRKPHGCDLRFDLQVPRSSIVDGLHEEISYGRVVFCRNCVGNGGHGRASGNCEKCLGLGELEETRSVRVFIPPGSPNGTRLRVEGAGDYPNPGNPPGDLVILVHIIEGR